MGTRQNRDRLKKIENHVKSLQELLVRAYSQFLFVRPMLANHTLLKRIAIEQKTAGFERLRDILYLNLILELVKICDDKDDRTPSIRTIMQALRDPVMLQVLEDKYARQMLPQTCKAGDLIWKVYGRDAEEAGKCKFAVLRERLFKTADEIVSSAALQGYARIRDKLIAHNELRKSGLGYEFFNIRALKLKFGQERILIEKVKAVVDDLNSIVRNACFAWDSLFEMEIRDVCKFWEISEIE
ncbi:MAG TPA: hypothetical protein DCZ95_01040 [Verrucomicrobia bacterium]|nr:MAG: hypothetical protein A2X46_12055 [Lentisphaerae bacterium GWF2_57_35]HBA82653.1 hypothetical protein [Verrucomicrobiota bacterium]